MLEPKQMILFLFDTAYVFAPVCGFLPQIFTNAISYHPLLSLLTIFACILKLFPSQPRISSVLLYQFCFSILVHFYLIKTGLSQGAQGKLHMHDVLPNFRKAYRYVIFSILSFILILGILDTYKYTHFFMRAALAIETLTSLLHIKLLEKKSSLKLLSAVLLLGDLLKTILFITKYSTPLELIIATLVQLCVNIYLTVR